jgi:pyruvate carboxylase subunit A
MFNKILIANRGEIAVRVMRACKELDVKTVAVYSSADRKSIHRVYADESYLIGNPEPKDSYLDIEKILKTAKISECEAIHPGYGFLSENPEFAQRCEEEGFIFIGPSSKVLEKLGSKLSAKELVREAGVQTTPNTSALGSVEDAENLAMEIGYPLIMKVVKGGGGIGMSIIRNSEELKKAYEKATRLGKAFFKDSSVYLEKYLQGARHIEFQILADHDGNVVHLGERECSIQRRYQKIIEETPSPALSERRREEVGEIAKKIAKKVNYRNAGTIEFLFHDNNFYFLEVNPRVQVEHPITELVTGIDIVKTQIKIAAGEPIPWDQEDINMKGHAIECRIYAEDPIDFSPQVGKIHRYRSPGGIGVRVDSGIHMGYEITHYYDPLISKLTVWGTDRKEAISRMRRALYDYIIDGVKTNIPFHIAVMTNEKFVKGETHVNFVESENITKRVADIIEEIKSQKEKLVKIFWDEKVAEEEVTEFLISKKVFGY